MDEAIKSTGEHREFAQQKQENSTTPWYASVWFNLLMISLSICFCSVTAFYPPFVLGKNKSITLSQKKFLITLEITVGILTLLMNLIITLLSIWGAIFELKKLS